MTHYVLGFAFEQREELGQGKTCHALLIQKERPDWMAGKWNGIGGKVEQGERAYDAMVREFREETGIESVKEDWKHVIHFWPGDHGYIDIYRTTSVKIDQAKSMTDEHVAILNVDSPPDNMMSNLYWMLPLLGNHAIDWSMSGPLVIHQSARSH